MHLIRERSTTFMLRLILGLIYNLVKTTIHHMKFFIFLVVSIENNIRIQIKSNENYHQRVESNIQIRRLKIH